MAEERRLTKRERREQRRREQRIAEREQRKEGRRKRILTIVGTIAAIAGIVALFVFTRDPAGDTGILIDPAEAEQALEAAGCVTPDLGAAAGGAQHLDPASAPPADQLYPARPVHSGPHFPNPHATGVYDNPIDERQTTHSLEHGGVAFWYVPDDVEGETVSSLEEWARNRNNAGFNVNPQFGAGIIVAPFPDGTSSGKPIAIRAWGVASDCDEFDETVADAFLISNFTSHGQSPEGAGLPYPEDVLAFSDAADAPTQEPTASTPSDATEGGATEDDPQSPATDESPGAPAESPSG